MSRASKAPRVESLGPSVGDQVRAPSVISSFHAIVEELVLNALDSGASLVEVKINSRQLRVEVLDDGRGMGPGDLQRCGEWHASSKTVTGGAFGFRGEALAAIAFLSDLEITSKQEDGETFRKLPHASTSSSSSSSSPSSRGVPVRTSEELSSSRHRGLPHGTLVVARCIFHNLPVRLKVGTTHNGAFPQHSLRPLLPLPSPLFSPSLSLSL